MFISIASRIRKIAFMVSDDYSGDSPYLNIPIYQQRIEPEPDSKEIGDGPPSMYNDPDEKDELKKDEDIRRQGERPTPVDWMDNGSRPMTDTLIEGPFEDTQGEPMNDTTTPDGRNENNDTIGFDPGTLNGNPFQGW